MKASFVFCLVIGATIAGAVSLAAQTETERTERRLHARQQALANAVRYRNSGQEDAAEDALAAAHGAKPGSGYWHVQNAGALINLAFLAREQGEVAMSIRLAGRALKNLDQAQNKLSDTPEALANIHELRASVYERLWGNSRLALESLRQAAKYNPSSETLANQVRRLEAQLTVPQKS